MLPSGIMSPNIDKSGLGAMHRRNIKNVQQCSCLTENKTVLKRSF